MSVRPEVVAAVTESLRALCGRDAVGLDQRETTLSSLDLDSLDEVAVVIDIETALKVDLPEDKTDEATTVGDLWDIAEAALAATETAPQPVPETA